MNVGMEANLDGQFCDLGESDAGSSQVAKVVLALAAVALHGAVEYGDGPRSCGRERWPAFARGLMVRVCAIVSI